MDMYKDAKNIIQKKMKKKTKDQIIQALTKQMCLNYAVKYSLNTSKEIQGDCFVGMMSLLTNAGNIDFQEAYDLEKEVSVKLFKDLEEAFEESAEAAIKA